MCYSVLQCGRGTKVLWQSVCWSVWQPVAVCCSTLRCVTVCCGVAREQRCPKLCCSLLQCVALRCNVLQCVAVWQGNKGTVQSTKLYKKTCNAVPNSSCCLDKVFYLCWHCVAVCCSLLQCVAIRCNVLKCVAVLSWQDVLSLLTLCCSVFQRVASVLQGLTLCCSVLQCLSRWWGVFQDGVLRRCRVSSKTVFCLHRLREDQKLPANTCHCILLQWVAKRCRIWQCFVVWCNLFCHQTRVLAVSFSLYTQTVQTISKHQHSFIWYSYMTWNQASWLNKGGCASLQL